MRALIKKYSIQIISAIFMLFSLYVFYTNYINQDNYTKNLVLFLCLVYIIFFIALWSSSYKNRCKGHFYAVPMENKYQIFSAMQTRWVWQDSLMWGRVKMLVTIQGIGFVSIYTQNLGIHTYLIFIAVACMTMILGYLSKKDESNRNNSARIMNLIVETCLPNDNTNNDKIRYIVSGGGLIRLVITMLLLIDLVFIIKYLDGICLVNDFNNVWEFLFVSKSS